MKTIDYVQVGAGLAATAVFVLADVYDVELSKMTVGVLAGITGWVVKRPTELVEMIRK